MVKRLSKFIIALSVQAVIVGSFAQTAIAAKPPRLIVNIVVGSMEAEALTRYAEHYDYGGLRKLLTEGAVFTDARFDCMQSITPASLATLASGAMPSTHGIVSEKWFDYTTGKEILLTDDANEVDFDFGDGKRGHSPRQLIAPTLADMLIRADSNSRAVSLALSPTSSIIPSGRKGLSFWMDEQSCRWTTSSYYLPVLPGWVKSYNTEDLHARFLTGQWSARFDRQTYVNQFSSLLFAEKPRTSIFRKQHKTNLSDYEKIQHTPIGNTVLFDFAKYAVKCLNLGNRDHTDLLNICLDTSREVAERYGPESVEYEDMLYRLDLDLKEFLAYLYVHLKDKESLLVVFTSAHGSAPARGNEDEERRFNVPQFQVIMNAYLNAKYGQGQWVLGYSDRSLYLNRNFVDEKRLSLIDVQNETAAFALRFRGVSHALSSTMLQSSHFAQGYAHRIQNSFYPRRSGDVVINLMPEWIEDREDYVSQSGSMYGYDTRVPLIFYGAGITPQTLSEQIPMTVVAPTLAHIIGVGELPTAEAKHLILE